MGSFAAALLLLLLALEASFMGYFRVNMRSFVAVSSVFTAK